MGAAAAGFAVAGFVVVAGCVVVAGLVVVVAGFVVVGAGFAVCVNAANVPPGAQSRSAIDNHATGLTRKKCEDMRELLFIVSVEPASVCALCVSGNSPQPKLH